MHDAPAIGRGLVDLKGCTAFPAVTAALSRDFVQEQPALWHVKAMLSGWWSR